MHWKRLRTAAILAACSAGLIACTTKNPVKTTDYGTAGIGSINVDQRRAFLNCHLAGDSATKIVELRAEGKSDEQIIKHYTAISDTGWLRLIYDLLPIVAEDNPQAGNRIEYGRELYGRCLGDQFEPEAAHIATLCYQQSQFLLIAFSYRDSGEPMESVYTKMGASGRAKLITDGLLLRAKEVSKLQESKFRLETYYGCLGHPDKTPI